MNVREALQEWGLNDKEAKVYLALLQLGLAKVADIAKQAGILRETTYFVLNSLIAKGLVSTAIKKNVNYFEAADPSKFLAVLGEREELIKQALPELEAIRKATVEKPVVALFEGKEGLKTILDDIIKEGKPMLAYASYAIFKMLRYEFPKFITRRIENKIFARILQERVPELVERAKEQDKKEFREMRFLPTTLKSHVVIYGDKVAFLTLTKEHILGVVVQDASIAATQRQVFELLWQVSD